MKNLRRWAAAATAILALTLTAAPSATADPVDPLALDGGRSLLGDIAPMHDPALVIDDDGTWYSYTTGLVNRENGGTIQTWSSDDEGTTWDYRGTVWEDIPAWIDEHFADGALPDNLWAPEIYENDGIYYLYYSASRFGTDHSLTALATNTTLDPDDPDYAWVDQGLVISSPVSGLPGGKLFNAIDAGIVEDADGTPSMAIGSFWYGIFLVPIEWPSGKPVANWQSQTVHLADRFMAGNPIEAPYITQRDGYFYLFVSFGSCCQGASSTYQVAVGRSTSVTGPYLDKEGRDMFGGGGTIVLDRHGAIVGPGGQSVFGDYLAFHYYDASNEAIPYFPTLGIQKLSWVDGWPVADQRVELPTATLAPADTPASPGALATFTSSAVGTPLPVATWEISRDGGATWAPVSAADGTVGQRTADVTGEVTTATSTLTVTAPAATGATATAALQVRTVWSNPHGRTTTEGADLLVTGPTATEEPSPTDPASPTEPASPTTPPTATESASTAGPSATSPSGSTTGAIAPSSSASSSASAADGLAATGSDAAAPVALAALLLLGGAGSIVLARRRRATVMRG